MKTAILVCVGACTLAASVAFADNYNDNYNDGNVVHRTGTWVHHTVSNTLRAPATLVTTPMGWFFTGQPQCCAAKDQLPPLLY